MSAVASLERGPNGLVFVHAMKMAGTDISNCLIAGGLACWDGVVASHPEARSHSPARELGKLYADGDLVLGSVVDPWTWLVSWWLHQNHKRYKQNPQRAQDRPAYQIRDFRDYAWRNLHEWSDTVDYFFRAPDGRWLVHALINRWRAREALQELLGLEVAAEPSNVSAAWNRDTTGWYDFELYDAVRMASERRFTLSLKQEDPAWVSMALHPRLVRLREL